jgi:sugar/nucleoside kinase (ribokinase family)
MSDVVMLGDINVDIIAHYPAFPAQGRDAFAYSTEVHCGGSAANTAMALVGLGIDTALVARVGPDPWAPIALRRLVEAGVCLDGLQRDPAVITGLMYVIVTPDGERTILGYRGANALTDPAELREDQFRDARLVCLSGYAMLVEPQRSSAHLALDMADRHGLIVALDPGLSGQPEALERLRRLLPGVHLFLPNLAEAREVTGLNSPEDCARALLDAGIQVVALKLGKDGCLIYRSGDHVRIPGLGLQVQDSTGAGDSFAAGFIAGYLGGLELSSAAALANAMGACAASRVGAGWESLATGDVLALLTDSYGKLTSRRLRTATGGAIDYLKSLAQAPREGTCDKRSVEAAP